MDNAPGPPTEKDLADARRYLPGALEAEQVAFATRQVESRASCGALLRFYQTHPCRVARIHVLTATAVTIARFWGIAESFAALGRAMLPTDLNDQPRTVAWRAYAQACAEGRPWDVRDELWMQAHLADFEQCKRDGLDVAFYRDAQAHQSDPIWRFLALHMEMTLGSRLTDHLALAGHIPYETAISDGIAKSLSRVVRSGWALLARYAAEGTRALLLPAAEKHRNLPTYRRMALCMMGATVSAWSASRVYRRGIRHRDRGTHAEGDAWALLQPVLGEREQYVHPLVLRFYANPSQFGVRAALSLHTLPAHLWSWAFALLFGQGLYETTKTTMDARFRVFRRADGSMHFVRELHVGDVLRVFDSDFVVRAHGGVPTLFEIFAELGIEIAMTVSVRPDGGLAIRGKTIFWRGLQLPSLGLEVEFISRPSSDGALTIDGYLCMRPRTAIGRFFIYSVLRRPEMLGQIHYSVRDDAKFFASDAADSSKVS